VRQPCKIPSFLFDCAATTKTSPQPPTNASGQAPPAPGATSRPVSVTYSRQTARPKFAAVSSKIHDPPAGPAGYHRAMAQAQPAAPLKVFVSYSRRHVAFADRLVEALQSRGFEVLIDRQDLPKLEDWERELLVLIRQSDTVVFIVSPHSLASKVVGWEVEQVRFHGKRLAPVVIGDVDREPVPREIARINYVYFTDETLFEARADELADALYRCRLAQRAHPDRRIGASVDRTRQGARPAAPWP
jgi:hypothetical protein